MIGMPKTKGSIHTNFVSLGVDPNSKAKVAVKLAKCVHCDVVVQERLERFQAHLKTCAEYKKRRASEVSDEECEYVKTKKPNLIDSLRRNGDKCTMQLQFARSVVSCGFPFSCVENEHFKKFSELVGFTLPTRKTLVDNINTLYEEQIKIDNAMLKSNYGTVVCDGWSKHQKGITSSVFCTTKKEVYVSSQPITSDGANAQVLTKIVSDAVGKVEDVEGMNAKVVGFVSDSCNTMKSVRANLAVQFPGLAVFGCSAHAWDLELEVLGNLPYFVDILAKILEVQKAFRTLALATALLECPEIDAEDENGKMIKKRPHASILPPKTRWHRHVDVIENYFHNWPFYAQVLTQERYRKDNADVFNTIYDDNIKSKAESFQKLAMPLKIAIKDVEGGCGPDITTLHWLKLRNLFHEIPLAYVRSNVAALNKVKKHFSESMGYCLSTAHFAAFVCSFSCRNFLEMLKPEERLSAQEYLQHNNVEASVISTLITGDWDLNLAGGVDYLDKISKQRLDILWNSISVAALEPIPTVHIIRDLAHKFAAIVSTSAPVERLFSYYGLTWTALRNRLTAEHAHQLVYLRWSYAKSKPKSATKENMTNEMCTNEVEVPEEIIDLNII